ncbi:MAG: tRNA (adenosine(37)-N6)-threonylcarbamoyltransferase complex dimerization subunit type 1 TsaB [Pseudomonadota bacterium]
MRILAFECSGDHRSAALLEGDRLVGRIDGEGASRHAETLIPAIGTLLAEVGWRLADLDLLAVGHGPGSFTGVRIAVAAARGLALALDRPVIGIDGRDVLLDAVPTDEPTALAAIDAWRGGVYAAWRTGDTVRHACRALPPERVAAGIDGPFAVTGSGAALVVAASGARGRVVDGALDAPGIGRVARRQLAAGRKPAPGTDLQPLYLRAPDALPRAA